MFGKPYPMRVYERFLKELADMNKVKLNQK